MIAYYIYVHVYACIFIYILYVKIYIYIYMWQRLQNIGLVTGPGGHFATRLVTQWGGLATTPPCNKPIEDYSTLHRGPRHGFVTEGPRQRFVTEGCFGTATNPCFESQPYIIRIYIYMYIYIYTYIYMMHRQTCAHTNDLLPIIGSVVQEVCCWREWLIAAQGARQRG